MKYWVFAAAALAIATPGVVMAEDTQDDGSTVISLSAEAHRKVAQDALMASLRIEKEARTAQEAQSFVNTKMQEAKKAYDQQSEVKASNGGYTVHSYVQDDGTHPLTPEQRQKRTVWKATQTVLLDSKSPDKLLKLTGQLQGMGFAVDNLSYYVSRELSDQVKDELTLEALGTIQQRAKAVAQKLGMKTVRLAHINLSGGDMPMPVARPMMAIAGMKMEADAMSTPVAQSGESEINVQATANVRMK